MKTILFLIISVALVVSGYSQTRNVLVGTNNAVVVPTNFWSADAANARSGLGLGTAATNPASAFQPSSTVLSNLALGNGGNLTNVTASAISTALAISNTTGLQSALDSKLATNGSAAGLTNFPTLNQNTTGTASNVTGIVVLANGGTGGTNAATARTGIGATTVGANLFTLTNPDDTRFIRLNANNTVSALTAADMRTALSVGTGTGTVTSVGMTVPSIFSLSTATITASGTFGLTLANQSSRNAFLAPNGGGIPSFRAIDSDDLPSLAISKITGLQTALDGKLSTSSSLTNLAANNGGSLTNLTAANVVGTVALASNVTGTVAVANGGSGATTAGGARTNLGLVWAGLTNIDAASFQSALFGSGTNAVLYNTNGDVVAPTNFWQAAPIATTLQNSFPIASSTNAATNARLLFLFSLAPSTVGVTNTITLPTNGSTFNGDVATITHSGPTSSVTAIRQLGASTNLITINQPEETVRLLYRNNQWTLMDNISQIEPIYFSGTNAAINAAASRTNLGLGTTNNVTFSNVTASGVLTSTGNLVAISNASVGGTLTSTGVVTTITNLNVGGSIAVTNAAATRTNLGLGGGITTNLILKNSANQDTYMNFSNGILIYGSTTPP